MLAMLTGKEEPEILSEKSESDPPPSFNGLSSLSRKREIRDYHHEIDQEENDRREANKRRVISFLNSYFDEPDGFYPNDNEEFCYDEDEDEDARPASFVQDDDFCLAPEGVSLLDLLKESNPREVDKVARVPDEPPEGFPTGFKNVEAGIEILKKHAEKEGFRLHVKSRTIYRGRPSIALVCSVQKVRFFFFFV